MSVQDGAKQLRAREGLSRRDALKLASAAAVAGGGAIGATQGIAQTAPTFDRLDHVYFLLNMHWFQAGLYSYALKGETLPGDLLGPRTAGAPPEPKAWARITFADTVFRDFVEELLATEIDQIKTLLGIERALDGPGKRANFSAPQNWLDGSGTFEDGFSRVFSPIYNRGTPAFNPYVEDHFRVVSWYFKDLTLAAYQTTVSKVPGDTTFTAFMAIQAYGAAILSDMLYDFAQRPGPINILYVTERLAARQTPNRTGITPVSTASGVASNLVPTDNRGRALNNSYLGILGAMVGPRQINTREQPGTFIYSDFIGRISNFTLRAP